jgi:hypothetical protein
VALVAEPGEDSGEASVALALPDAVLLIDDALRPVVP